MDVRTKRLLRRFLIILTIVFCIALGVAFIIFQKDGAFSGNEPADIAASAGESAPAEERAMVYPSNSAKAFTDEDLADDGQEIEDITITFVSSEGKPVPQLGVSIKIDAGGEDPPPLSWILIGTTDENGVVVYDHTYPGKYILSATNEDGARKEYSIGIPSISANGGSDMSFELTY